MAKKYTYSKLADQQIQKIYRDTAIEWGFDQAEKYDAGLLKAVLLLAEHPDLGRKCDEIKAGYQRYEYERHIIFYRQRENDIFIVQILHDRQDAVRHL